AIDIATSHYRTLSSGDVIEWKMPPEAMTSSELETMWRGRLRRDVLRPTPRPTWGFQGPGRPKAVAERREPIRGPAHRVAYAARAKPAISGKRTPLSPARATQGVSTAANRSTGTEAF